MLIMSFHYFVQEDSGILDGKVLKDTLWYKLSFFTHITFGGIAITLGPFQFLNQWIEGKPSLHKTLGYVYSAAVVIASCTGLIIAQFAMGGVITQIGFSTLSIIWFFSLIVSIKKVLQRDICAHKKWMQINYALTFSAITQRSILLFAFMPSFSFMPIYQLSSWLSWIINLLVVMYFIRKSASDTVTDLEAHHQGRPFGYPSS